MAAGKYRDFAALRGDTSDNLPGALGIGAKTAAKLLAAFAGVAEVYAAIDAGRASEVEAVVGRAATRRLADPAARANVERNLRLMAMRHDLPLPELATMRVPMDVPRLHARSGGPRHPARPVAVGAHRRRAARQQQLGVDGRAGRRPAGAAQRTQSPSQSTGPRA